MTQIVVLFNLKPDVDEQVYKDWAISTDLPTVNALPSVNTFSVLQATGVLGSELPPPFQYVEIIDIGDMKQFGDDVSTETMRKVAGEFQAFADSPMFITTEALSG